MAIRIKIVNKQTNKQTKKDKVINNNFHWANKDELLNLRDVRENLPSLETLNGQNIDQRIQELVAGKPNVLGAASAGTSAAGPSTSAVSSTLDKEIITAFLTQYYCCMDTDARNQLVHAYIPTAKFTIESNVAEVPSQAIEGSAGVEQILTALPATRHNKESFQLEYVRLSANDADIRITGELEVFGRAEKVQFVHSMTIVRYNQGLGGAMTHLLLR